MAKNNNDVAARLWLIPVGGEVKEILAAEYGELKYQCPRFDRMRHILQVKEIEHVNVWWQEAYCHMFVDEVGLLFGEQKENPKATRIYYNNSFWRAGRRTLIYKDLNQLPYDPMAEVFIDNRIMGPALLWTGGME